jgi:hypothetical protein
MFSHQNNMTRSLVTIVAEGSMMVNWKNGTRAARAVPHAVTGKTGNISTEGQTHYQNAYHVDGKDFRKSLPHNFWRLLQYCYASFAVNSPLGTDDQKLASLLGFSSTLPSNNIPLGTYQSDCGDSPCVKIASHN